ncbi:MAG TPA: multiheme c-type cytochrome [Planctomycetaceae bacterium]|jgi:2',3'-cyclic-nucleotide 2'-phosphodiesterase (5'-nucleotidase family)|nr:multiheme c-type cytochrome [Planctomycetaceae bacterium]
MARPLARLSVWRACCAAAIGVLAVCAAWAGWHAKDWSSSVGTGVGQADANRESTHGETPKPMALVISGDTQGWIVPCGCTANQSGGLLRRATFLSQLRQSKDIVVADAGGAPGGASDYDRCKFEFILGGERLMGSSAHNLGGPELALGVAYLQRLAKERTEPLISANAREREGRLIAEPFRIVSAGRHRVALLGVVSSKFQTRETHIDDPKESILATLPALKGCDVTVVLAYLPEDELRQLAAALPEIDAIIGGPTGQSLPPKRVGASLVASATNKGKFLIELSRVAESGRAQLSGSTVEMTKQFGDDADQAQNLRSFYAELQKRDFNAAQTSFVPQAINRHSADYTRANSATCAACHQEEFAAWQKSGHAHAWATLEKRGAYVDAACQRCHTTGFGVGGFESRTRSPHYVDVQCESCHGGGSAHAKRPETKTLLVARDLCAGCHDHENSPEFEFAAYWAKIVHGEMPSTKSKATR